jgi:uncharacterized membrane protein
VPHITPAHLHVLINHIPIIGIPLIALFLAWGLARREEPVIRVALIATVILGALTWVTMLTGDGAKDDIEHLAWVNKDVVEEHEDSGDWANISGIVMGVAALGALVLARKGKPVPRAAGFAVLALMVFATAVVARTGWLGGKIRHDEFGLTPAPTPTGQPPSP